MRVKKDTQSGARQSVKILLFRAVCFCFFFKQSTAETQSIDNNVVDNMTRPISVKRRKITKSLIYYIKYYYTTFVVSSCCSLFVLLNDSLKSLLHHQLLEIAVFFFIHSY